jgi:predicted RNA binding protein YcfA (HicA-like mRNA interferase family)
MTLSIKLLYEIGSNKNATFVKMKVRELLKLLRKDGWIEQTQKGSHLQLEHPVKKGKVTVPVHGGDIPKGTLNSILKQSGLK